MRKKLFAILLVGIFVLSLYACGSNSKTDLSGTWKTKEEDGSWMEAEIQDDVITINWISDEGESTSVFWVGSYDAPKDSGNEYSWESKRDKDKTDKEPLASSDDTKKFTYKDGKLTYQMTGFGVTTTMSMTAVSRTGSSLPTLCVCVLPSVWLMPMQPSPRPRQKNPSTMSSASSRL